VATAAAGLAAGAAIEQGLTAELRKDAAPTPVTAEQVMPSQDLMDKGRVRRNEGFFQSASRILGPKASITEVHELTKALKQMWIEKYGNDTRKLAENHHFITGENIAYVLNHLTGPNAAKIRAKIMSMTVDTTKKA
jgi:hypothetical protein